MKPGDSETFTITIQCPYCQKVHSDISLDMRFTGIHERTNHGLAALFQVIDFVSGIACPRIQNYRQFLWVPLVEPKPKKNILLQ